MQPTSFPTPPSWRAKHSIDIERLRAELDYDQETGKFTWKVRRKKARPGMVAGKLNNRGYIAITFYGEYWLAHRLVWAHVHGFIPPCEIDHINRVRNDNRLRNLRLVSRSENQKNSDRSDRRKARIAAA